jgi:hypothetical protein
MFQQPLHYLDDYLNAMTPPTFRPNHETVALEDLETWASHVLLTAAARISPQSQGKANLFEARAIERHQRDLEFCQLRSRYFVGGFPLEQLRNAAGDYRHMTVRRSDVRANSTTAGWALLHNSIELIRVKDQAVSSHTELDLKTTHILGIPLRNHELLNDGEAAVITVDLKIWWPWRVLAKLHLWPWAPIIKRRAREIQTLGQQIFFRGQM